jgi:hypothetical protein
MKASTGVLAHDKSCTAGNNGRTGGRNAQCSATAGVNACPDGGLSWAVWLLGMPNTRGLDPSHIIKSSRDGMVQPPFDPSQRKLLSRMQTMTFVKDTAKDETGTVGTGYISVLRSRAKSDGPSFPAFSDTFSEPLLDSAGTKS